MGSQSCCCCQSIGMLRDLRVGEYGSSREGGRRDSKGIFAGKCAKEQHTAWTCANREKYGGVRSDHCGTSMTKQQSCCNANGGGLQGGMESSVSRAVRQRWETRTHSLGLLCDSILEPLSACRQCIAGTSTSSGFVMAASSSSDVEDGDTNRKTSRSKLSMRTLAVVACFGGIAGLITALLSALPPNFERRWKTLLDNSPPQAEESSQGGPQSPTVLFDCHGVVIASIAPGGYRYRRDDGILPGGSGKSISVCPAEIPSWMWQAVVASEDRRFFKHQGVDPRGVSRAVLSLGSRGGGSTITQQLIKNVMLTNERKWTRKLLEILLALALEKQMTKWDILHLYLKKIYWGHGVYGIEGASALYFGKHPSHLTLAECAMLAGMIPAPEILSPYRDPSRGKKPQGRALRRMVEAGFLDTASAVEAVRQPLQLAIESNEGTSGPWRAPYFVSEVLYELTQKYGWSKVACGGLQVHTTLDLSMQSIAEKVVLGHLGEYDKERICRADEGLQETKERLAALQVQRQEQMAKVVKESTKKQSGDFIKFRGGNRVASDAENSEKREEYLQVSVSKYQEEIKAAEQSRLEAAMVAIDPLSGAVRVLVGGRDYYESNFNRGTEAHRSPGSTFKPVVYLTALAKGFQRDHVLMDEPLSIGGFSPENHDRKFCGKIHNFRKASGCIRGNGLSNWPSTVFNPNPNLRSCLRVTTVDLSSQNHVFQPVTLEESLLYSLNVPTVRLCAEVGVDKVCEMGRALGIDTFLPYKLALSLGGCEVTPMQLATVYATIAAGGVYHKPHLISRVESQDGQILEEQKVSRGEQKVPVVNENAVAELRSLLQAVVDKGTGRAARLGRPCAGQAGTSNEHRDVWFAGFTPEISCVVWLGYDDNATVGGLHPATGASHAAPIWKDFMKAVHEGVPVRQFHDVGSDKYGSRPKQFVKRSRRTTRIGLKKIRKDYQKRKHNIPWIQVWDWKKASAAWEEQEKMNDWIALRMKRATSAPDWAGQL